MIEIEVGRPPPLDVLTPIEVPADTPPVLVVVVDTEEEFDWSKGFDPGATSVRATRHIGRVQSIFDRYSITPTYVVDYPIASQADGIEPLKEIADSDRAVIGAHLHPWVNPPVDEEICARNSFPGNLPGKLEAAKIRALSDRILESFGSAPRVYKAGRYGLGRDTARTLVSLGYEVDASVSPGFDWSAGGGPDFSRAPTGPGWLATPERGARLLEVPRTGAFVGFLGRAASRAYDLANRALPLALRVPGILARLGAVDRLALTPEGYGPAEHRKLADHLLARGERVLSWTFHSPSVEPGCTSYVRSEAELGTFLDSFERFFDFFLGERGGTTMTPLQLRSHLETIA